MARRLRAAFIAVVIGGLLAGCGDGGNGGGTPGPDDLPPQLAAVPDPCTLVTTEEATAALGKQTKDCDLLGKEDFHASARFLSADDNPGSIEVQITSGGRAEYDGVKQAAAGKKEFAEISGVGEAAFFMRPFVSAEVIFLRGPYVVSISVGFVTGPPAQAVAVTLAQQAAARIAV
jgi:hypothetical protein